MAMALMPGKRLSLGKPFDIVTDNMAARFDAAVIGIDGFAGLQFLGRGIIEIAFDVVMTGRAGYP